MRAVNREPWFLRERFVETARQIKKNVSDYEKNIAMFEN